jgi:SOS regulatory protein LexA
MTIDEAIKALKNFYSKHKRLPSYREMTSLFGYASKNASYYLVKKLIELKILAKDSNGKLSIGSSFFAIPLLGSIKAGIPDEAYQNFLESVTIDNFLVDRPGDAYALQVNGDSMIEAGIIPGDIVIIEKGKQPKEKDIVVAEVDGGFTLKYFHYEGGKICLLPANKNYKPIYPESSLSIFGTVVSVIRKYH